MKFVKLAKAGAAYTVFMIVVAMSCMSVFANDYTTKTEYVGTADKPEVTVTATAANVPSGDSVTYVAYNGTTPDEKNIVHINQDISNDDNNGVITFEYTTTLNNIGSTQVFGGTTSGTQIPVADGMYKASVVIEDTETEVYFDSYAENTTPYIVAREFSLGDYSGAIENVLVDGETVDFIVNEGIVTMYTDKIDSDGCTITVTTTRPRITSAALGIGEGSGSCFVVNCKTDLNVGSSYGVLVCKDGKFNDIVEYEGITEDYDWENKTIAFPALGKNKNGVYAVEFSNFEAGTYHFAAYVKSENTYTMDTQDINDESVSYTFN